MQTILHLKKFPLRRESLLRVGANNTAYRQLDGSDEDVDFVDDDIEGGDEEDKDVARERARITAYRRGHNDHAEYILRVLGVSKTYRERNWLGRTKRHKEAVRNLTFGVRRGEVFCLLGPNGAGKTSLLSIISGFLGPSKGSVFIGKQDIFRSILGTIRDIGVCPQNNRLYEKFSVRQHIRIYNGLRGILFNKAEEDRVIRNFCLQEHAGKAAETLSGGNKRKLSVAMAFIGQPKLILLDEPSTGMDFMAKRTMWDRIMEQSRGCGVILTTHSMEEADALSSRIAIMVNGSLQAIGTSYHLKQRFGSGFRLSLTAPQEQADSVEAWVKEEFPDARCVNCVGGNMSFEIPRTASVKVDGDSSRSLPLLFEIMEKNKDRFGITDYSVGQASLEQVFLQFAREQHS